MVKSTTGAVTGAGADEVTGGGVCVTVTVTGAGVVVGATVAELGAVEVDAAAGEDACPDSPPALPMPTPTSSAAATAHTAGRLWKGLLGGAVGNGAVGDWPDGSYGD
jgi:hypothetical protein